MMNIWGGIDAFREQAAAAQSARADEPRLVNGPRLDGDPGHASQAEIDAMFARMMTALVRRRGRRIAARPANAISANSATTASTAGSLARSATNASTSGAIAWIIRNGSAMRPMRWP